MQKSGRTAMITDCGVTPQAQNTGSSSSCTGTASPQSGRARSLIPINCGFSLCPRAPSPHGTPVQRQRQIAGHVAEFHPSLEQRLFERKRTADRKSDQIVAPPFEEIGWLVD